MRSSVGLEEWHRTVAALGRCHCAEGNDEHANKDDGTHHEEGGCDQWWEQQERSVPWTPVQESVHEGDTHHGDPEYPYEDVEWATRYASVRCLRAL
jgi:hypothetical protein